MKCTAWTGGEESTWQTSWWHLHPMGGRWHSPAMRAGSPRPTRRGSRSSSSSAPPGRRYLLSRYTKVKVKPQYSGAYCWCLCCCTLLYHCCYILWVFQILKLVLIFMVKLFFYFDFCVLFVNLPLQVIGFLPVCNWGLYLYQIDPSAVYIVDEKVTQ